MSNHLSDALAYAAIMQRRYLINQEKDMGCDIHFIVEKKINDRWIGVYSTQHTPHMARSPQDMYAPCRTVWCDNQDYAFFAAIAGVRGEGPEPNGLPEDISELAQADADEWAGDVHSHGHMPLIDFVRAKMRVNEAEVTAAEVTHQLTKAGADRKSWSYRGMGKNEYSLADMSEYHDPELQDNYMRVVFFFDN